MWRRGSVMGS